MKFPAWLLPIIATAIMAIVAGGFKFYVDAERFHAVYEDETVERIEDDEERDARLDWLRDRVNELRGEHGKELAGWPELEI